MDAFVAAVAVRDCGRVSTYIPAGLGVGHLLAAIELCMPVMQFRVQA